MEPDRKAKRPFTMRRSSLVLGTLLLGLAAAPVPSPIAAAECAGPNLEVDDGQAFERGATTTVTGNPFTTGCQDVGVCSSDAGCDDDQVCDYGPEPQPRHNIRLKLVQGDRSWHLGTVDADSDGSATWTFEVPRDAEPGRARLVADVLTVAKIRIS